MPLYDIGPVGYHQASGVATLSFIPQLDRAAIVKRILVDKVSASDVWVLSVQGVELARFDIQTTGNQQPLAAPYSAYPKNNDIFSVYKALTGQNLIYPVPLGQTLTIASVGGATANITIAFQEVAEQEINQSQMNHPQGRRRVLPLVGFRSANITAVGENTFDTQVGPSFFPNVFVDGVLPPSFVINVLGVFLEGGGRNTFSGAADHQSITTYMAFIKNGQRYYTRDNLGGIPLIGQAAAAGSANTVVSTDETPYPPFQETDMNDWGMFDVPFQFGPGSAYQLRLNVTGDVTGGATYAAMRQMFLCDVTIGG